MEEPETEILTLEALGALYEAFRPDLARTLGAHFALSQEDTEDLLQETFTLACRAIKSGTRVIPAKARGWLWRIGERKGLDWWRHGRKIGFVPLEVLLSEPATRDTSAQVIDRAEIAEIWEALTPGQRLAVWHVFIGSKGKEHAGGQENYPASKMHLYRARQIARKLRERGAA